MNLITKLLMENETTVITLPSTCAFHVSGERTDIVVVVPKCVYDVDTKKELLSEVREQFYVSEIELMLMDYWLKSGVHRLMIDTNCDVYLGFSRSTSDSDVFCQKWSRVKLFQFLEINKNYDIRYLINHSVLIEG